MRKQLKTLILIMTTVCTAQEFFPRIIFYDPFTAASAQNQNFLQFHPSYYDYYADDLADCGFNVIHTKEKNTSDYPDYLETLQSRGLMIVSEQVGGNNMSYVYSGYQEIWPVGYNPNGGDIPYEHHLSENYYEIADANSAEYWTDEITPDSSVCYIRSLADTHDAGEVLDGSAFWAGFWRNSYGTQNNINLFINGYIDTVGNGNISALDTVVTFHIYEQDSTTRKYSVEETSSHPSTYTEIPSTPVVLSHYRISFLVSDFDTPGIRERVRHAYSMNLNSHSSQTNYIKTYVNLRWHGNVDFYLDGFELRSVKNQELFTDSDSTTHYDDIRADLISAHNSNGGQLGILHRFYIDEPKYNEYRSLGKINELAKDATNTSIMGATGGSGHRGVRKYKYIEYVQPEEVLYNFYPIRGNESEISTSHNSDDNLGFSRTLQDAWNGLTGVIFKISIDSYNKGKPFMHTVQVQSEQPASADTWRMRNPLVSEISAQVWLALAHNAKGIMYFLYSSGSFDFRYNGLVAIDANINNIIDPGEDTCYDPSQGPYLKNDKWYKVQEINRQLALMEPTLLALDWKNSYSTEEGAPDINNPDSEIIVQDIYSVEFPGNPYIQIAHFEHGITGEDYFMLVNRRCCIEADGECIQNEGQTLTVTLDITEDVIIEDIISSHEEPPIDTDHTDYRYLTNGQNTFDVHLAPGEGRLYKIDRDFSISISDDITWSGTRNIYSDIVIEQGGSLTINPGTIIRIEEGKQLSVYGMLAVNGTADSPVQFLPINEEGTWGGVHVKSGGSLHMDFGEVSQSDYTGIRFDQDATGLVMSSEIHNNVYGIMSYFTDNALLITNNNIHDNSSAGIYICHSSPEINDNSINNNGVMGLLIVSGSNPVLRENHIYGNGYSNPASGFSTGITIFGSSPVMSTGIWQPGNPYPVNNRIHDNANRGIYIYRCSPNLGVYDLVDNGYMMYGGFNHIYNQPINIYWYPPTAGYPYPELLVEVNYWYSSLTNGAPPNSIEGPCELPGVLWNPTTPVALGIADRILSSDPGLRKAIVYEQRSELDSAKITYEQYLDEINTDQNIFSALSGLSRTLAKLNESDEFKERLEYYRNEELSGLNREARIHLLWTYKYEGRDEEVFSLAEELMEEYSGTDIEAYVAMVLALLYSEFGESGLAKRSPEISLFSDNIAEAKQVVLENPESESAKLLRLLTDVRAQKAILTNLPTEFSLHQNYPNPFNPITTIMYDVPKESHVTLTVYDLMGRVVRELVSSKKPAGTHHIIWNGTDAHGQPVASGMYLYRLKSDGFVKSKKLVLLK